MGALSTWVGRVVCEDNCEALVRLPPACVDLVVTSPPYDSLRRYAGHTWDFYGVAWLLRRALKPGGVIVWVVNDQTVGGSETGTSAAQAEHFRRLGLKQWDTMIYAKDSPSVPTEQRYYNVWEYMFVFSKGVPKTTNWLTRPNRKAGVSSTGETCIGKDAPMRSARRRTYPAESRRWNVWEYHAGGGRRNHAAPFPYALARDHILSWSNPGDLVLDPFAGSGTALKAARDTGREFIGIDIDPRACATAEELLSPCSGR
jgi:DNA modification methylase